MKLEQLEKGKQITAEINNLTERIGPANELLEKGAKFSVTKLEIQVKSENEYCNGIFSNSSSVPLELREVIAEEISIAFERITRAFEKQIKKLEKEFETL